MYFVIICYRLMWHRLGDLNLFLGLLFNMASTSLIFCIVILDKSVPLGKYCPINTIEFRHSPLGKATKVLDTCLHATLSSVKSIVR